MKQSRIYNRRKRQFPRQTPFTSEEASITGRMEEIRNLSREISSASAKMEQWLAAMTNLSHAMKNEKVFEEFIQSISKMNPNSSGEQPSKSPDSKRPSINNQKGDKENTSTPKPFSKDGDSLYDLINAPGMIKIVDQVLKNKKAKKRRK
ncbi:hypothetical protein [Melghirimyces algeriensis]|uniref:Uncharacterized protein n=1 Tax=Melghirimyces algeriensis TaxID=910412 RepID=A0A521CSD3_9BACL|nr:hypothetical protein [Melghirimyces algeriensis]SMO62295.1 hypothetical protein SAMN06264849_104156 [Melghirimyces algeriensis]